jgi:cytochrome c553
MLILRDECIYLRKTVMHRLFDALYTARAILFEEIIMKTIHVVYFIVTALSSLFWTNVQAADVNAGKQLAANCAACHGADGNSKSPQYPSLAGQQAAYISAQLKAFRGGSRNNPVMKGMAGNLSDADVDNLAAYFASLKPQSAGGDAEAAKAGAAKYAMCAGCHGAKAEGNGVFPRLAGQQPAYLKGQLKNFKSGARQGGTMNAIAASLSEEDMNALTAYEGSLK